MSRTTFVVLRLALVAVFGISAGYMLFARSSSIDTTADEPARSLAPLMRPATPSKPREAPATHVTPIPELGDSRIQRLVDPNLEDHERAWGDIGGIQVAPGQSIERSVLLALLADPQANDTFRNEAANILRQKNFEVLAPALIKILDNANESDRMRGFAVQHLSMGDPSTEANGQIAARLREALDDRAPQVRREALLALGRRNDLLAESTALKWLSSDAFDANELRDAAIRCLHEMNLRLHVQRIRDLAYDDHLPVRIAALVALADWGDIESLPAFQQASVARNLRLKRAGEAALKQLESKGL
jgi:hypothetical protein